MTLIKICGITNEVDAKNVAESGCSWVGLNFWPNSKRFISVELGAKLAELIRAHNAAIKIVGVFVNQDLAHIKEVIQEVKLDYVQLHGDEDPAMEAAFSVPPVSVVHLSSTDDLQKIALAAGDFVLIDTPSPGYGGAGKTFSWELASAAIAMGKTVNKKIILAGGLHAQNVAEAIAQVAPFGVDVASGVESAPGKKEKALMDSFVKNAQGGGKRFGADGRFGEFGGQYIAETLMPAVSELQEAYEKIQSDPSFQKEFADLMRDYVGRPSLLTKASRLSKKLGAKIYLKREDLNHTGAHKINNCIGQILVARKMGKKRIIAETGAGQHGVATATVAALFGMPCEVYMGAEDVERQKLNVFRMELLGTKVIPVNSGTRTLKDAMNEAIRDWVTNVEDTYYLIGSVAGPHPYPLMVRDFQSVIGMEAREQILKAEGRLPHMLVACVGGGSNAAGLFAPFVDDSEVVFVGVEASGDGIDTPRHAATLSKGRVGILHGSKSYVLCDDGGQINEAHSISAGLDYPGVGPEHSYWKDSGRAQYWTASDDDAMIGLDLLAETEGIICALETAHAIAVLPRAATIVGKDGIIVVNVSGRGDKDMMTVAKARGFTL